MIPHRFIPVFDIGNVLIEWNPRHLYRQIFADEAQMEHFLADICSSPWNEAQDRGRSFAEGVRLLSAEFPEHEPAIRAYDERWHEMVPGPIQGTVDILLALRLAGVPTYAITNFSREKFASTQERFPFLAGFDGVIVSAHEGLMKPEAAIFELLLSRHDLKAEDCVFVDDVAKNVEGARAVGMRAIHFTGPEALTKEFAALGFPVA